MIQVHWNWASWGKCLGAVVLLAASAACKEMRSPDAYSSLVDEDGQISFPADFPKGFVFIGAWAVQGEGGVADIHAVHARPGDVAAVKKTGKFPDGAVLIKEVSEALGAKHTTGQAFWPHETKTWFMMVRDAEGRFQTNPLWGDGWGWAQFDPKDTTRQIAKDYKTDCLTCHLPVKDSNWVYTYAYPALGAKGQVNIPADAAPAASLGGHRAAAAGAKSATPSTGDAAQGKVAFETLCVACHSAVAGQNGIGPSLAGVVGKKAGSASGYGFSSALSQSGKTWSPENLDKHLDNPKTFIPGNRMGNLFPGGVKDAKQRADLIAYLKTLK